MMHTEEEKKAYATAKAKIDFKKHLGNIDEKALDAFLSVAYDFHLLYKWRKKYMPAEYYREYRARKENRIKRSEYMRNRYRNDPVFREKTLERARNNYYRKKKLCLTKETG